MKNMDLTGQNVLAMRDAQAALAAGTTQVQVGERCVVTPSARDFLRQHDIEIVTSARAAPSQTPAASGGSKGARIIDVAGAGSASPSPAASETRRAPDPRLFNTPEAEAVKLEICAVGKKLWNRQYVDGNGGNISYRIGPNEVLC